MVQHLRDRKGAQISYVLYRNKGVGEYRLFEYRHISVVFHKTLSSSSPVMKSKANIIAQVKYIYGQLIKQLVQEK
jgi:hypothetical protein